MTYEECGSEISLFLTKSTCLTRRAWTALQSEQDALNTFQASACMTRLLVYSLPQRS